MKTWFILALLFAPPLYCMEHKEQPAGYTSWSQEHPELAGANSDEEAQLLNTVTESRTIQGKKIRSSSERAKCCCRLPHDPKKACCLGCCIGGCIVGTFFIAAFCLNLSG